MLRVAYPRGSGRRIFGFNFSLKSGGLHLKPLKFEYIFVAVITSPPFFFVQILLISTCCLLCVRR